MQSSPLKPITGLLLAAACQWAYAASLSELFADYENVKARGRLAHVVDIDNDTLLLNREDGFYTSGVRYMQTHSLLRDDVMTVFGWRVGQDLYTPSDIKLEPEFVGPPDHPYAGWLYGGFFRAEHRADGTHTRLGIDIGCLGPCAGGEWTQTNFHRLIDQPLPKGWSKQVRNELGVVLYADAAPVRWTPTPALDLTPYVKGRFGNIFTDAAVGVTMRAGQLNMLPMQAASYAFLRLDARAVGYNATLQGGYFSNNNPHTVEPKRLVGEAEIGVVWSGDSYGAKLSLVRRGNEIRDLPDSTGAQNFVRLGFFYSP
jgi:lipid A 3-O-deacylase